MPSTLLSAAAIKAAKLRYEDVEVPEWGGTVRIQQMSALESMEFSEEAAELKKKHNRSVGLYLMLVYSARDEQGQRIFAVDDIPFLMEKGIAVLNRLQMIALRLNRSGVEEKEVLKKDLSVAQIDATLTPSLSGSAT